MGYKHTDSCLAKVADDEPIFVLRAQDTLAAELVRQWADKVEAIGGASAKVTEARQCAALMDAWPTKKIPD